MGEFPCSELGRPVLCNSYNSLFERLPLANVPVKDARFRQSALKAGVD